MDRLNTCLTWFGNQVYWLLQPLMASYEEEPAEVREAFWRTQEHDQSLEDALERMRIDQSERWPRVGVDLDPVYIEEMLRVPDPLDITGTQWTSALSDH